MPLATQKISKIVLPEKFKAILEQRHEYYIFHSGRGCGKSVNIIICLIILAAQEQMRILCVREIMSSLSESVKATIEEWIERLGVSHLFVSTRDEIRCINGSVFLFRGLQTSRAINIKSISNIKITFVEEAEAISEASWELLVPSVMRRKEKDCSIICALNPRYEEDVIAQRFLLQKAPPKSYICKLTKDDNPFFYNTQLPAQMAHDEQTLSPASYRHKWLGEFLSASDDCLFNEAALRNMKEAPAFYERENYVSVAVGVDPATTDKKFSNRYGVVVVGITKDGEFHVLENASSHFTPHEFALKTAEMYSKYKCDCAVVETNAGGDFVKAALIGVNAFMRVEEVRATQDKVKRSLPVANLAAMGKLKLFEIGRNELLRECKNMTIRGYTGAAGESPDMLDATAWAIYYLGKLRELDVEQSFFDMSVFADVAMVEKFAFVKAKFAFEYHSGGKAVISQWLVLENEKLERLYVCESWEVVSISEMQKFAADPRNFKTFILEDGATENILNANAQYYEKSNLKIDELAASILPRLTRNDIVLAQTAKTSYNGYFGNVIKKALEKFKLGGDGDLNVEAFCHLAIEAI